MTTQHPCGTRYVLALLLALLSFCAVAQQQTPDAAIHEATDKLRTLITQNHDRYKADIGSFYAVVDQVVVPRFDAPYIGKLVLGRSWKSANESQRRRFVTAFKNSLVHTYATALLDNYNAVKEDWKPVHSAPDASDANVHVDLLRQSGPPVPIGFSVHRVGTEWLVYDVTVDGVSLASNFRSQFSEEIAKNGLDQLIERLAHGGKPLTKTR